jgi:hypothetical protein
MSKRVLNKINGAFQSLGIELKKGRSLYEFEYEHIYMFLSMDAKDQSIAFITYVVDSGNVSMNEDILNTALDVVEGFHEDYSGDWNEGVPYFVSPCYELRGIKAITEEWLQEQLKAFYDAYMFLEANIHLLCDTSIFGLAAEGVVKSSVMSDEELEAMILKDFIANTGLICIDAGDIKMIRDNSDFMDGNRKTCYAKDMKEHLQTTLTELIEAHPDARLERVAVKLLFNKESELMMEEMSAINEVFDNLEDVELIWGIGRNENSHDGKIAICIVAGFRNN